MVNVISFLVLNFDLTASDSYAAKVVEDVMTYTNYIAVLFLFPILNIYFIVKSLRLYHWHKQFLEDNLSYSERVSLRWIHTFIWGYLLLLVGVYIIQLSGISTLYIPMSIYVFVYLVFIGYKGLIHEPIDEVMLEEAATQASTGRLRPLPESSSIASVLKVVRTEPEAAAPDAEETDSLLSDAIRAKVKSDLLEYMETEKPHLDPKLSIHQLAQQIQTNNKYLSYVINNDFEQNFVTFINSYRVEEAKKYFQTEAYAHYTIEAISKMAGFRSKSSFNAAFKNMTGKTPSQYRKQNK